MKEPKLKSITLDPLSFPLYGARLIEASAGTGKTFTICSLYLRLLLGHGSKESRHPHPLSVDKILVVTFTESATEELRSRIRNKVRSARLAFARGHTDDAFISEILNEVRDHDLATTLLLQAERQMDEAAIYTIHGFCQRMLTNNAFESGSLFETSFVTDETKLRKQVVSDYWRSRFYSLPASICSIIRKQWKTPSDLLRDINSYLSGSPVLIKGTSLECSLEETHYHNIRLIKGLKAHWLKSIGDLTSAFDFSDINRRSYTKKSLPKWLNAVTNWAEKNTDSYEYPKELLKFGQDVLIEKSKSQPPSHFIFSAIQEFLDSPPALTDIILKNAIEECRVLLKKAKNKIHVLAFDDLLSQLGEALKGNSGRALASRIREMYPIAMIDEFQDTDPVQYSIFSRIYKTKISSGRGSKNGGFFMIGDPKQAIYSFRGADIFTYIKAREEVDSHFTLCTNWRSTGRMVDAVNTLFSYSSNPFVFTQDIPFNKVLPAPEFAHNHWTLNGDIQPAISVWLSDTNLPISKKDYIDTMTEAAVAKIQTLLSSKNASIIKNDQSRDIKAGDLAILVRTSSEARTIKKALTKHNIPSVYLSNRNSVFSTLEAKDILRIMVAISDPLNSHALKPALATHFLGATAESMIKLESNEHLLEQVIVEFTEYQKVWEKKGIFPALQKLVLNRNIAECQLSTANGERQMADFFHIAELLQQESEKNRNKHSLIRWLTEKIAEPNGNLEEQQTRLESDSDLIKITTIHKAKGLEYNFVFLPYLASYKETNKNVYHDEKANTTVFDTKMSPYSTKMADKERLAEDIRLLYVALTRAVYGCFIGLAPLRDGRSTKNPSGMHKSAIGWILQKGESKPAHELQVCTTHASLFCQAISVTPPPATGFCEYGRTISQDNIKTVSARVNQHHISENWYVTSFTGLTANSHSSHPPLPDVFNFSPILEEESEEKAPNIFTFHKGAKAGTFLHNVFENIDYRTPDSERNKQTIEELLLLEGYEKEWTPIILQLANDVLTKKLGDSDVVLADLSPEKLICEMEFIFPINKLKAEALTAVCAKHDPLSQGLTNKLNFFDVSGMLKGFIDLTFECNGKFYVLDWKSNHLGSDHDCYTIDAISKAMQDHRYDLQYQIYSLALHKFLQNRLPNYTYEKNFGGALYLFLRGVNSENNNGVFYTRPTEHFLNELDSLMVNN